MADTPPSLHTLYELLNNSRRRAVIEIYSNRDEPLTLKQLSEQVAAIHEETTPNQVTGSVYEHYRVSLMQDHLPRLERHDIINYDRDRQRIAAGEILPMTYRFLRSSQLAYQRFFDRA